LGVGEDGGRRAQRGLGPGRPEVRRRVGGGVVVGPLAFGHYAELVDHLDPVANLRAIVEWHRVFDIAFVPINEEPGGHEIGRMPLLSARKLQRAGDGVGRAGADAPLIVDHRQEFGFAEIDLGRKRGGHGRRSAIDEVAVIGQVGNPAVTVWHNVLGRGRWFGRHDIGAVERRRGIERWVGDSPTPGNPECLPPYRNCERNFRVKMGKTRTQNPPSPEIFGHKI
jgi:hypothetical protein